MGKPKILQSIDDINGQLNDIAINVSALGLKGDATDETQALTTAISMISDNSTLIFERDKTYKFSSITINKKINFNFNGCTLIIDLTTKDTPFLSIKGSEVSTYIVNTINRHDITATINGDISGLSVGDTVFIKDSKFIPAWDSANPSPQYGQGYTGRNELNIIKSISGQVVTFKYPVEVTYDTSPKLVKLNTLDNVKVIGDGVVIREVDKGSAYTGTLGTKPNLISFTYCKNPFVDRINIDGWQLEAISFNLCFNPIAEKINGKNPFRPSYGNHGYVVRFLGCRSGLASKAKGESIRHLVDYVQSYDCSSKDCLSVDCLYGSYETHGFGSRRITSINDTCINGVGWVLGNPSFNADYDFSIINPKYYSINPDTTNARSAFSAASNSDGLYIINPIVKTNDRLLFAHSGSNNFSIDGGIVEILTNSVSYEAILIRPEITANDNYKTSYSKNVKIKNVKFNGRTKIVIKCEGEVIIKENTFNSNDNAIDILYLTDAVPDIINISTNYFIGTFNRGVYSYTIPNKQYIVENNTVSGHVTSPMYIPICDKSIIRNNKFIGVSSFVFSTGDYATSILSGAVIDGNVPKSMNQKKQDEILYSSGDTFDLNGYDIVRLACTSAQTLTYITGGYVGQTITIYSANFNPTLTSGTHTGANNCLVLRGGTNVNLTTGQTITLRYMNNKWYEIGRGF